MWSLCYHHCHVTVGDCVQQQQLDTGPVPLCLCFPHRRSELPWLPLRTQPGPQTTQELCYGSSSCINPGSVTSCIARGIVWSAGALRCGIFFLCSFCFVFVFSELLGKAVRIKEPVVKDACLLTVVPWLVLFTQQEQAVSSLV